MQMRREKCSRKSAYKRLHNPEESGLCNTLKELCDFETGMLKRISLVFLFSRKGIRGFV
ncbi:hypothetical protein PORCRE_1036 [Porphyromonas crevioricanis JCM 15906]|uniref:Uncharacterized protein n=1 Tax=Porphyromonas crevioricanis JCM 15906 TaxID=1305617 RepID=T1CHG6_9PORP|nr:hypothetical protein PORCRE_1036 [Porphyromonas crevioricanis JCM 15906]GAD08283.1 hypothetical protein PORCAN_1921 [Porphyromonas crevioricanis JCM 13913]